MNCSAGCSCNFVLAIYRSNTSRIREGWVTERSIVHAWKACVPQGTRGSNPLPSVSSFILLPLVLGIVIVIAASAQIAPAHYLQILPQLYDVRARHHAANVCPGINDAISADDGTGIKHRIATDLGPVANNGAEFGQSGRDGVVGGNDRNFAMIEFYIR